MNATTLPHAREIEPTPHWPALMEHVAGLRSVIVAFSAGVDSTLLAKVAHDVLGPQAIAATAVSPSLAPREREQARQLAALLGIEHVEVTTHEAEDPLYVANSPERCFACKSHLFVELEALRRRTGHHHLAYGAMADDLGDHRPGMRAAAQAGVVAPLLVAGLGKAEIREASRRLGLPTWDKPALACLASRIPHGTAVTPDRLALVDAAESAVRELGFGQVRVRHHGELARVEVEPADVPRALTLNEEITRRLVLAGFARVEIDPRGYRGGGTTAGPPLDGAPTS